MLLQEHLEQRGEERLPARLIAEDFARVGTVRHGAQRGDEIARRERTAAFVRIAALGTLFLFEKVLGAI